MTGPRDPGYMVPLLRGRLDSELAREEAGGGLLIECHSNVHFTGLPVQLA